MSTVQRIGIVSLIALAFFAGNAWQMTGAQAQKVAAKPVTKWEVTRVYMPEEQRYWNRVEEHAEQGWELAAIIKEDPNDKNSITYAYMKRPKQ